MKFNLEGLKFNHLTVIGPAGTDGRQHRLWECKCDCGMNYRYMYDRYVRDTLGRLNLADINTSKMKAFYTSLITEKGFKPITVDNVHTVLNPIFSNAVDDYKTFG